MTDDRWQGRELGGVLGTIASAYREVRTGFTGIWDDLDFDVDDDTLHELVAYHEARFGDYGYSLGSLRLFDAIGEDEENVGGRYSGRVLGRAQLQVGEKNHVPVLAHEIGHDVESELARYAVPDDDGKMVGQTFSETFAYLNMLEVADELEMGEISPSRPFSHTDDHVWDVLDPALSLELANRRIAGYLEVDAALEDSDIEAAHQRASEIARMPPDAGGLMPDWLAGMQVRDNMFLDAIGYGEIDERVRGLRAVLGSIQNEDGTAVQDRIREIEEDGPGTALDEILYEEMRETVLADPRYEPETLGLYSATKGVSFEEAAETVRETIIEDRADEIREDTACDILDELRLLDHRYCNWVEDIEDPVEAIVDGISHLDYGQPPEEDSEFDDAVDIPHTIGYEMAAALREAGYETTDIVEDPATYAQVAEDTVRYTVATRLYDREHDRDRMLEYVGLE